MKKGKPLKNILKTIVSPKDIDLAKAKNNIMKINGQLIKIINKIKCMNFILKLIH
jgi:hypothetical protein